MLELNVLVEFYVNEKMSLEDMVSLEKSYQDFLIRLGNRINSDKKQKILDRVKHTANIISEKLDAVSSCEEAINVSLMQLSEQYFREFVSSIEERNRMIIDPIAIAELDLNSIAHANGIEQYVTQFANSIIKPNIIPDEYKEKELLLTNLKIRKGCYEAILKMAEKRLNNQQKFAF